MKQTNNNQALADGPLPPYKKPNKKRLIYVEKIITVLLKCLHWVDDKTADIISGSRLRERRTSG